jgi:hypothetical protein
MMAAPKKTPGLLYGLSWWIRLERRGMWATAAILLAFLFTASGYAQPVRSLSSARRQNYADRTPETVTFKVVLYGEGRRPDGVHTYFTDYKSSQGHMVYVTYIKFDSVDRAAGELAELLKNAVGPVEKSARKDKSGKQIGERIFGVFNILGPGKGPAKKWTLLAWTSDSVYQDITADTADDVLALEKQLPAKSK